MSEQEIALEIQKCILGETLDDQSGYSGLLYFIEHYIYVKNPSTESKGVVLFNLYGFQRTTLRDFLDYRFNIVLKARQIGMSTLTAAYCVWFLLFFPNREVAVVANTLDTAVNLIKKVKYALRRIPEWMYPVNPLTGKNELVKDDVKTLTFGNDSTMKAYASTSDAGRSDSLSLLIIDEAAVIDVESPDKLREIWTAAEATLETTKGRAIWIATPRGQRGYFYDVWCDAQDGKNNFHSIFLPWDQIDMPGRDEAWAVKKLRDLGGDLNQLRQEYGCWFLSLSQRAVVPEDTLNYYASNHICDPIAKLDIDKALWVWAEPEPDHTYVIAVDVASGDSKGDYSAFQVIDIGLNEQVAEYQWRIVPSDFAFVVLKTARTYNDAIVCVERNSNWHEPIHRLLEDREYFNIYREPVRDNKTQQYSSVFDTRTKKGFDTTSKSKRPLIDEMLYAMLHREFIWHSERLYQELQVFQWLDNGSAAAAKGRHDDTVIAVALGIHARTNIMRENTMWEGSRGAVFINRYNQRNLRPNIDISSSIVVRSNTVKKNPYVQDGYAMGGQTRVPIDTTFLLDEESRRRSLEQSEAAQKHTWYEEQKPEK